MLLMVKTFQELTTEELYRMLQLREAVFVVEQQCCYHDMDNRDQEALHVWLEDDNGIQAYLRVMDKGVESSEVSLGRVIAAKRGVGLGRQILQAGIAVARNRFGAGPIYLEAQLAVRAFYEKQGFQAISDVFLLDGIPHIAMQLA